nr:ribonuclease H-like domain-containing protein [Tanacetum cinerariifolium]
TKWVFKNKKDKRGIVIKNKEILVAQGYTQEEGIDYDEVFAPVTRIEAIRLFLAYALFKDFVVYQMDVKSAFLCGKIKEEVYVFQPPCFEDLNFPNRDYIVEKELYGLHQAPRAWKEMCTEFEKMMHKKFQTSSMGKLIFFLGLQVKQKEDGIFISQDKYVNEILNNFGASLDRKFTIEGCQFLGFRLISHQYKKQTVVANSTTKAEDSDEKKLIQMIKIYTDKNIADLLTKAFNVMNINEEAQLHAKVDGKKVVISEASGEIFSLEMKEKKHKLRKTRRQDTKETQPSVPITNVEDKALNEENVTPQSNDPRLLRVNILRSGEDRLKLKEFMELYTKRSDRIRLSARVESSTDKESLGEEDASKQGRIYDIDDNQDIYLVNVHRDEDIFGVNDKDDTLMFDTDKDLKCEEVVVKEVDAATIATATSRPKAKRIVMQEPNEAITTTIIPQIKSQDKDKGIMVKEPLKMKKKDQISFDEQETRRLQAEIDEQGKLAVEEAQKAFEANIVVIAQWHDVQAKIDADYELAQSLEEDCWDIKTKDFIDAVKVEVNTADAN